MSLPSLQIVTGEVAHRLIHSNVAGCVDVVRETYLAHAAGETVNPDSQFLRFPDKPSARIIALPAHLGGDRAVSGIKWIASYPENVAKGIARASAVIVLNDATTGYPFVLLEASIISAARTAASAVLAAGCLRAGKPARSLGIVGAGLISRYTVAFLLGAGWTLDEINVFDTVRERSERWCEQRRASGLQASSASMDAVLACDVVVMATTAGAPHITDPKALEHNPLVLHLSLRDLGPEVILTGQNFVDDIEHALKANTSLALTAREVGHRNFVAGTIADLVRGRVRPDPERPRIFSPFGMGILDVAMAKWVYDQAQDQTTKIDDFFFDTTQ